MESMLLTDEEHNIRSDIQFKVKKFKKCEKIIIISFYVCDEHEPLNEVCTKAKSFTIECNKESKPNQ